LVLESLAVIDREKVLAVLHKRFPGARGSDIAAAANAIVGLGDEWEEVTEWPDPASFGVGRSTDPEAHLPSGEYRLFHRRSE
jgi:hypothetical protein